MHVFADPENLNAYISSFLWILRLTGASAVIALVVGTILAAMRVSPVPVLRGFGTTWVNLFRNTPLTLIIFFAFFALGTTFGVKISDDLHLNAFWLAVVGLSVYTAAFVCEAIRSGINTIPAGQAEAARAIGLTFFQTLRMIILPQAGRAVIAPLGSILIALTKNATIAGTIGVTESSNTMKDLINENGDAVIAIFLVFAGTFVALLVPTGYLFNWLAARYAVRR